MDGLPEELLAQIISHLSSPPALAGLCRTNRRLNRVATPALYSRYETSSTKPPSAFLSTLLRRPDLARNIKSLSWDYSRLTQQPASALEAHDIQHALRTARSCMPSVAENCAEALRGTNSTGELSDALLTTTLLHVPNLEDIEVVDAWYGDNLRRTRRWLDPIRMQAPQRFQCLKSASVTMVCLQLRDVVTLLQVPSLRRLQLCSFAEPEAQTVLHPPCPFSGVEDLSLRLCRLNWNTVAWIMSVCRGLKSFTFVSFNMALLRLSTPHDLLELKRTFDMHKQTLEYVDVEIDVLVLDGGEHGELGSFKDYPLLHHQRVWLNPFKPFGELRPRAL